MATQEMNQYNASPTQNSAYIAGDNVLQQTLRQLNEQNIRNRARMGGTSEGALAAGAGIGDLAVRGRMDLVNTGIRGQEAALAKMKDAMNQVSQNQRQKAAFNAAKVEQYAANLGKLGSSMSQAGANYIMSGGYKGVPKVEVPKVDYDGINKAMSTYSYANMVK